MSDKRKHGIGHERLSIIDPESGAQPLFSRDGQVNETIPCYSAAAVYFVYHRRGQRHI